MVGKPDLALLYNRSAANKDANRNPIIAIPGLMGSKLTDAQTGKVIWGGFDGLSANPARPPKGLQMFLVAGDGQKTPQQVSVSSKTGQVKITKYGEGDETVLRSSALLDEREGRKWQPKVKSPIGFHSTMFLSEKHVDLTKSQTFRDNILYWLLEDPRHGLKASR